MSRTASTTSRICWTLVPPVSLTYRRWSAHETVAPYDECCRQWPDDETTTMRVLLVPSGEPPPPRQIDALDRAWRYFPADLPTVTAAIDSMCETINLPPQGHHGCTAWPHCHHHAAERRVYITMHAHAQDTVVGVHFQPITGRSACDRDVLLVTLVAIGAPVALLAIAGNDAGSVFGVLMFELVYWLACVTFLFVIPRWRRRRAVSAWTRALRRSFWASLEARLAPSRIYR